LQSQLDGELNFAQEVEKLPATDLYMLDVQFETAGHIYGALVLQLLQIPRIRVATKTLKVVLPRWRKVILLHPYRSYVDTHYMSNTIYVRCFYISSQLRTNTYT
jgi:hypothetical protein